jgi:cellulose synthase/poly-beta-1,6-N-acetylglucosamine synthase-like glycosyltransferase
VIALVAIVVYTASALAMVVHALLQRRLLAAARRVGRQPCVAAGAGAAPAVTVQLPVFNERFVVERLLDRVAALSHPRERLEIQVLDDSTDDTRELIDGWIARCAPDGLRVVHLRRSRRTGFKAGALAAGLRVARGDFIAIFDADFLPPPDFLDRTLPRFADERVAAVQGRWQFTNRGSSALADIAALLLDAHFLIEQPGRAALHGFVNFNGSGGVWRAAAIRAAGGWSDATLTEDVDLSYRAQLRGWRIIYDPSLDVPNDLPDQLRAFRAQQHRWMKGMAQNARRLVPLVARAPLPWRVRLHACAHLAEASLYLALGINVALAAPIALLAADGAVSPWLAADPLLLVSFALLVPVYWSARVPQTPVLRFAATYVALLLLSLVMAFGNAAAVLAGYSGARASFARTPKRGGADRAAWKASGYGQRLDLIALVEATAVVAILSGLVLAAREGALLWAWPAVAFMAFCTVLIAGTAGDRAIDHGRRTVAVITAALRGSRAEQTRIRHGGSSSAAGGSPTPRPKDTGPPARMHARRNRR